MKRAPKERRPGPRGHTAGKLKQGSDRTARQKAWQVMRIRRTVTVTELVTLAGIGRTNATRFCAELKSNGYLRAQPGHDEATRRSVMVYTLVNDTGPYAPRVGGIHGVADPNLDPAFRKFRANRSSLAPAKADARNPGRRRA